MKSSTVIVVAAPDRFPVLTRPHRAICSRRRTRAARFGILLDLGSGALGALQRYVALESIDAVLLSHLHADHCLDLCGFYVVRKYRPDGPCRRCRSTARRGPASGSAAPTTWTRTKPCPASSISGPIPRARSTVGPFEVVASEVDHPVVAYGLRVSAGGRTLAYTGDTGPCAEVVDLAKGADLLLAEASFLEGAVNPPNVHMTGREAAVAATDAGVRQTRAHPRAAVVLPRRGARRGATAFRRRA